MSFAPKLSSTGSINGKQTRPRKNSKRSWTQSVRNWDSRTGLTGWEWQVLLKKHSISYRFSTTNDICKAQYIMLLNPYFKVKNIELSAFVDRCLHIVDDYYIPFFNYVLNELNAKEACAALGLCKANTAFFQVV